MIEKTWGHFWIQGPKVSQKQVSDRTQRKLCSPVNYRITWIFYAFHNICFTNTISYVFNNLISFKISQCRPHCQIIYSIASSRCNCVGCCEHITVNINLHQIRTGYLNNSYINKYELVNNSMLWMYGIIQMIICQQMTACYDWELCAASVLARQYLYATALSRPVLMRSAEAPFCQHSAHQLN